MVQEVPAPIVMHALHLYVAEELPIVQISGLQMELLDTLRLAILAYIVIKQREREIPALFYSS